MTGTTERTPGSIDPDQLALYRKILSAPINHAHAPLYSVAAHLLAGYDAVIAERDEARNLARALYSAIYELVDSLGELTEINPELNPDEHLPHWLTGTNGAPETWQRDEDGQQ